MVEQTKSVELFQTPNVPPGPDGILHKSLTSLWRIAEYIPKIYFDFRIRKNRMEWPRGESRLIPEGSKIHESAIDRKNNLIDANDPKNLPERYTEIG